MADNPTAWERWFERVWADREERIYRSFFGGLGEGIYNVPPRTFTRLGVAESDLDPRWLHHGVFECPPTARRASWLYVTSGLSNPWGETPGVIPADGFSGLGMEFVLEAPERSAWALGLLHWLTAIHLLTASGRLEGGLLEPYDRVPLGASIDPARESALRNLLVAEPSGYPGRFQLESGRVDLLLVVGTTDEENALAARENGQALASRLIEAGVFPRTDPARESIV